MNNTLKQRTGIAILAGCLCVAMVFLVGAAPKSESKAGAKYEYTTVSTEMKSLQTELTKLGKERWYVVSIVREDVVLAQEDGKNHIRTAQVTIVAKRPQER